MAILFFWGGGCQLHSQTFCFHKIVATGQMPQQYIPSLSDHGINFNMLCFKLPFKAIRHV